MFLVSVSLRRTTQLILTIQIQISPATLLKQRSHSQTCFLRSLVFFLLGNPLNSWMQDKYHLIPLGKTHFIKSVLCNLHPTTAPCNHKFGPTRNDGKLMRLKTARGGRNVDVVFSNLKALSPLSLPLCPGTPDIDNH